MELLHPESEGDLPVVLYDRGAFESAGSDFQYVLHLRPWFTQTRSCICTVEVVGVEEDLRISTFDRKGSLGVVPCDVEFLEEENPPEGSSWGKWYAANSEGATITDTR